MPEQQKHYYHIIYDSFTCAILKFSSQLSEINIHIVYVADGFYLFSKDIKKLSELLKVLNINNELRLELYC